ncbi:MAG: hypothetical protein ACKOJF_31210, partial [Planctomycetaceae bacterium]
SEACRTDTVETNNIRAARFATAGFAKACFLDVSVPAETPAAGRACPTPASRGTRHGVASDATADCRE